MTDDTEKLEWPERMYLLHPSVKTFGDMISIPERQEYVHADQIKALEAQRDGFQQEAENYINLLGKALAERDAAWNEAIRAAAKAAGDAAVTVLLRHAPDATLFTQQVKRQSVAVPVLALLKP